MKPLYLICYCLFIFASCTPNTKPEKMLPAKKDTVTKRVTKPAAVPVAKKQVERTTLSYIDFILFERSKTVAFMQQRRFQPLQRISKVGKVTVLFEHHSPAELLLASSHRDQEGGLSVAYDYYFFSEVAAKHFTDDLVAHHKFTYNEKQTRYTLFLGTYETKYVVLHKQVVSGRTVLYRLEYRHNVGKELSAPMLTEQDP